MKIKRHAVRQKVKSLADLEKEAGLLSSYDGDLVDFGGARASEFLQYTGEGDDLVDFAGHKVAFHPPSKERIFQFDIINGNGTNEVFRLAAGLGSTNGLPTANGSFNSVAGNALTMAGNTNDWQYFLNFYLKNPVQVQGLFISSDVEAQLQTSIVIERHSPFRRSLQTRQIYLPNYSDENTFQTKKVTVPEEILFDDQQAITLTAVANSTTSYTFYCGAVLNNGKALAKKIAKADNFNGQRQPYGNLIGANNRAGGGRLALT